MIHEQTRLYALTILVGLFAGISGITFRWLLNKSLIVREWMFRHDQTIFYYIVLILGMWGVALLINWLKNHVSLIGGSGIPQSKGVIFDRFSFKKPWLQFISKFFGSLTAIGMGLSLGREGPSVEIGAFGASIVSKYFKVSKTQKRYLTIAGSGAGLAAAFTAPLASVIFLLEDMIGWVSLRIILPGLIACIISGYCAQLVFTQNIHLHTLVHYPDVEMGTLFLLLIGLALLSTYGGKLFNYILFTFKRQYQTKRLPDFIKIFIVILLTFFSGMYLFDLTAGAELALTNQITNPGGNFWWIFCLVPILIFLTCISYSTGLCGSLLLPLIVMGGLLGKAYGLFLIKLGVVAPDTAIFFTIIGMSLFFISVVRAPISGLMLILEMTGQYEVFFPMIITGTLTYLFGQYAHVKPVYHTLYKLMLIDEAKEFGPEIETHFKINVNSILIDKPFTEVNIPGETNVIAIIRDNKPVKMEDCILQLNDLLHIKVKSDKYEELFPVLRALTNE